MADVLHLSDGAAWERLGSVSPTSYSVGLALLLLTLVFVGVKAYRTWQEVNDDVEPVTHKELLASFKQAREAGELDDDEFARVRRLLGDTPASRPDANPTIIPQRKEEESKPN
jgi:hypothetical protein